MKKPEEIKKGLACCAEASPGACERCPYVNDCEDFGACKLPRDALAYINQLEARVPKWIPVGAEEKPMHGEEYLCICALPDDPMNECKWIMVLTYYAHGSNGYVDRPHFTDEGLNGMTVTHWMPLPKMPKEE